MNNQTMLKATPKVSDLRERLTKLTETVNAMDELKLPLITSSMGRLSRLMEKAEPLLQAPLSPLNTETQPEIPANRSDKKR